MFQHIMCYKNKARVHHQAVTDLNISINMVYFRNVRYMLLFDVKNEHPFYILQRPSNNIRGE